MCGITGFLGKEPISADVSRSTIHAMMDALMHRGPDDHGSWLDPRTGIALGHRRLSIIDLSVEGRQPMRSYSNRFVLVLNGEIYNYRQLMKTLVGLGHTFRGHSDTEVVLAAIEEWGLESAVNHFVGMFAFALWDTQERTLYLVRDRLGIKPLYYGWGRETFLFASELKALLPHPDFVGDIDRNALALYLRHNYVPSPYSIYKDIHKLPAGTILRITGSEGRGQRPDPRPYWSASRMCERGVAAPFSGSEHEAVSLLQDLLRDAVRIHMESDVPLGAFLSGGIDSSTVVALMQEQSSRPVQTFTIGLQEQEYNEARAAKAVAAHLGTNHTELYVTPREAMECVPLLPKLYDEPFGDSSQIPTYLVSKLTRSRVTVSLSGDGGDEIFAGYNRYMWVKRIWRNIHWLPKNVRRTLAVPLRPAGLQIYEQAMRKARWLAPRGLGRAAISGKLDKIAPLLTADNEEEIYRILCSHWAHPSRIVLGSNEPVTILTDKHQWAELPDFVQRMMFLDLATYLPDDILVKVDRASMAVSLEARVPLLDHRVVEFAWGIPMSMKQKDGFSKWILRQVLYKYVPRELVEGPKRGFAIPIGAWLRGPLRSWAESLLGEERLKREGFFDVASIREKWLEHVEGRHDWQYHLWGVLMFEAWLDSQFSAPSI